MSFERSEPCPAVVVRILRTLVTPASRTGSLLDNCAGDGRAAVLLARAWNLTPYLVEIDFALARRCRRWPGARAVHGRAENVVLSGPPSARLVNPPFDP